MTKRDHVRAATCIAGLAAFGLVTLQSGDARASSDAGIEIALGAFSLRVYYSDAVEYPRDAEAPIRDSRSALFALASMFQANAHSLKSIHHTVEASLYIREGFAGAFLSIIEDPLSGGAILREGPIVESVTTTILETLCKRYPEACRRPALATVRLYRCQRAGCPGRIRFGAFPSESVNQRFGLLPPTRTEGARSVLVTREQLARYYGVLDR